MIDKISERLARMITLLSNLMNNKTIFKEIIHNHREIVVTLLKLLHSDNYYISYLAGQCICSMLKQRYNTDIKADIKNRELILKSEIDLLKYIDRHLRVVDRYQQMKGSP